ncbi:MAG: amylo-alpha-1,6-glucosidase [Bacteroidia bacterium]|nr:amylo-alpha-1,6-glucosidase [Bacteroidia bacterium]
MTAAHLSPTLLHRYDSAIEYEWLETNGLGGFSSSTVIGTHTRRYHGLFVSSKKPPVDRQVLLSRLDETLHRGTEKWELSTVKYEGAIYPRGYIFQSGFQLGWFPTWTYEVQGIKLKKTICMPHGMDAVVILYELLEAPEPVQLDLRPLLSPRNIHDLTFANPDIDPSVKWDGKTWEVSPYGVGSTLTVSIDSASFEVDPSWYFRFAYSKEEERGMEAIEDLFTYGKFQVTLTPGQTWGMVISGSGAVETSAQALVEAELARRKGLVKQSGITPNWAQRLVLAADQFIAQRGDGRHTVIAGYPWFTDWGRDTMISLPGLCLATGRPEIAKNILQTFCEHISEGMIPNRFPDDGAEPEYNTIDASLWLFVAAYQYVQQTGDKTFGHEVLLPSMEKIINAHIEGTRFGIRMAEDGLLEGGEHGVQLTWMDAKVDDWVVTPRHGKSVEINALWYNAWRIYAQFLKLGNDRDLSMAVSAKARVIKKAFNDAFWNTELDCLYDTISPEGADASIRPNQIFAISLPFQLLPHRRAEAVLKRVEEDLYTPVGLRSLAPSDPQYIGVYIGDRYARDGAYHQGTVWSWLLGPFIDGLVNVRGELGKQQANTVLEALVPHLYQAGMGSVSEIFDGDAPHTPRGCYAQAWGIAEPLRVIHQYQLQPLQNARKTELPRRETYPRTHGRLPIQASKLTLVDL